MGHPITVNFVFAAILELDLNIDEFTSKLRPICLPHWASEPYYNENGIIAGWGKAGHHGDFVSNLQEGNVVIWNEKFCEAIMNKMHPTDDPNNLPWHTITKYVN